jgi:hypothetical protein
MALSWFCLVYDIFLSVCDGSILQSFVETVHDWSITPPTSYKSFMMFVMPLEVKQQMIIVHAKLASI